MRMSEQAASVDRELLLRFFLEFSRFEYALKASGMFKRHRPRENRFPKAEPDWDSFAASLRDTFEPKATEELERACEYINDSPPNHQIVADGDLMWQTPAAVDGEAEIQFLLRMVRTVRNNLFHGAKYSLGVHEDVVRAEKLMLSSLTILAACLALCPQQQHAYEDARL
jgi:hypothetical protein